MRSLFPSRDTEKRTAALSATDIVAAARLQRMGGVGTGGQPVTETTSMQLMAMWRCRHLIADIVSGLPMHQYRSSGPDRRPVDASEFVRKPSNMVEPEEWRYQMILDATAHGNAVAFVTEYGADGWPKRAESVDWRDVYVSQRGGTFAPPVYKINGAVVDTDRVLHLRAYGPRPGSVLGMSPLSYAAQTIGLGLAVREYGTNWYESGGHPTTLLTTDAEIDDEEALAAKTAFRNATLQDHVAVLGNAWKLESLKVSPSDALFLTATNATAVDICGYYGIPPEMLGYASQGGGSVTYANREQRALDLLIFTIQWWIGRMEKLISRQLPNKQFVKIEVDALLRSDAETRWNIHDKAVKMGARNIDRVRELEDEPPLPDGAGQMYMWPPQPATPATAQRDSQSDAERRDLLAALNVQRNVDTHIHLPESFDVAVRQEPPAPLPPPVINVAAPVVNVAAPNVTVEPPNVTVEVAAPNVSVAAADVTVPAPVVTVLDPPASSGRFRITRDRDGRITEVVED